MIDIARWFNINSIVPILFTVIMAISLLVGTYPSIAAEKEAPKISSSLAKNLWRQAHFYFEEGMDAKAMRACEELQAWARENNEPAIEKEMTDMLATLHTRQQPVQPVKPQVKAQAAIPSDLPLCGYASEDAIPSHIATRIVTNTPSEFLICRTDQDCIRAQHFCGAKKVVNRQSQACYETAVRVFDKNAGCESMQQPDLGVPVCRQQTCMLHFGDPVLN